MARARTQAATSRSAPSIAYDGLKEQHTEGTLARPATQSAFTWKPSTVLTVSASPKHASAVLSRPTCVSHGPDYRPRRDHTHRIHSSATVHDRTTSTQVHKALDTSATQVHKELDTSAQRARHKRTKSSTQVHKELDTSAQRATHVRRREPPLQPSPHTPHPT